METIKKKIQLAFTMLLTTFVAIVFSFVFSLASQQISIDSSISLVYKSPVMLLTGEDFNNQIPSGCTSIYFEKCENVDSLVYDTEIKVDKNLLGFEMGGISLYYNETTKSAKVLSKYEIYANTNASNMFNRKSKLTNIVFDNFNTSETTNMSYMFYRCAEVKQLDLSSWDTSNVTNMSYMFVSCNCMEKLDVSNFNTAKVTTMNQMFRNLKVIKTLDLSSFDTSKVENVANMFTWCSELVTIYVSTAWDMSSVTNSSEMFYQCCKLVGVKTWYDFYDDANHQQANPYNGLLTLKT